ncbi:MFS transporter [Sphingomonas solaris]|uniref:MFS transporter n=1 Tax=Alterirhizorhabdus solaris TaxID=2529389 RepID=A0A558RD50_9SPHN|nr:MFS transporter [Sphingomonas solaris]TVV77274.1 MFS transporter [Sphingomonas solaris]
MTSSSSDEPAGGAQAWWMVAALFLMYAFSWLDRLILSMLVTPIKVDLLLTDVQVSMITSTSFAIFYALFGLPLGWAADRFSRRWIIFGGVLVWASATVACGFARSYEALLVGRVMVGAGEAALLPAAYSLISDAFARDRLTLATSVFQMAGKIGSAAAFGLGGMAIAFATARAGIDLPFHGPAQPWQMVLMMAGAPGFVLALLVFTFPEPARRGTSAGGVRAKAGKGAMRAFLRQNARLIGLMLLGTSCLSICGYSMTNWVPAFIERRYGLEPVQYGWWLSAMNLIAAGSLVVSGGIVDRLYRRGMDDAHLRFYSWLILGLSPVILFTFFAPNVWLFLACYGVVQFITVPFMVYVSSVMALLAPNALRAQMLAMFLFVFTILGLGAGPAIVAVLTDHVFRDEAKIGQSLAVVVIAGATIAFVSLRLSLRYLAPAVARNRIA